MRTARRCAELRSDRSRSDRLGGCSPSPRPWRESRTRRERLSRQWYLPQVRTSLGGPGDRHAASSGLPLPPARAAPCLLAWRPPDLTQQGTYPPEAPLMGIKVTSLPDAERRPRHVAIGTFDGVHVGHRQVIDRADTVLTFEPHPLSVIHPEALPKLIMPFDVKRDVIEGLGVSELVVIPFDEAFSHISAEEFCSRILISTLGAERVSVGENFRFGAKAKGGPALLGAQTAFETRVVPLVEVDGETVSSS